MPVKSKGKPEDPAGDAVGGPISVGDIRVLFELMKANDIGEIELEQGGTRIHVVSRHNMMAAAMPYVPASVPQSVAALGEAAALAPAPTGPPPAAGEEQPAGNLKTIKSPMVGTFYRAASPDSDPFVRTGDTVTEDTVLCIIEAMKLFNEIKAECRGRINKVLVENGQPVEYNQPLFLVEAD